MKKFIPAILILFCSFTLIGYAYCNAPAIACLFEKTDALILPDRQAGIVSFGVQLKCKPVGNQNCSGVWYRLIVNADNRPVYWNADVISFECGRHRMIGCNVSVDPSWFGNGYKASQMVYDEATWLEIVSDGPVPLN